MALQSGTCKQEDKLWGTKSLSSPLCPHPTAPSPSWAGTLGCTAQLYGPGMTKAKPQVGLSCGIPTQQPRHCGALRQPPVTVYPLSPQHPPAEPLWEPLSLQPEPRSLNFILGCRRRCNSPLPHQSCLLVYSHARGRWLALGVGSLHLYSAFCQRDPH